MSEQLKYFGKMEKFNEIIKGDQLTLVDFYATWCGPCQMLKEELEELEKDNRFKIVKVDVDESEQTANDFNVDAVPSVFLLKDGKIIDSFMGYMPAKLILKKFERHFN